LTRPAPSARLAWKTRRLAGVVPGLVGVREGAVDALVHQILAVGAGGEDAVGRSNLNNDGTPLQLCLSAGRGGWGLKLIGDPGADRGSQEERYRASLAALRAALAESVSAPLAALAERTLERLLPATAEGRDRYQDGFLWVARSAEGPGIAFYVDAAPLGEAGAWEAAEAWLAEMLPAAADPAPRLAGLARSCVVASLGLEGADVADARAKVYFRLRRPMALGELGLDLLGGPELARFLVAAIGDRAVDLDGLVLCAGFHLATGELADVKADVCGHCLAYAAPEWIAVVDRCCGEGGLAAPPVGAALAGGDCEVAFIGCGVDAGRDGSGDHKLRLNLYLKSRPRREAPGRKELAAAADDAVRYLCRLQDAAGRWTDYRLPVGASDEWVTAYVGLALAQVGRRGSPAAPAALAAARRGAGWLATARAYPAGWGFNATTGPDADSTAMALGLAAELGLPPRPEDQAFLRLHWRPEGGLATFLTDTAWGRAHWDVTPWGYLGLSAGDQEALRPSFLAALNTNRMADGMWRAYWWRRPYYSTFLTLEALARLGLPEPAPEPDGEIAGRTPLEIDNAFDLACLLGVERFRGAGGERLGALRRALLDWQQDDGRWPGHPNLRVTEETCEAPWEAPAGECYADEAGTITTATALRVLAHVLGDAPGEEARS